MRTRYHGEPITALEEKSLPKAAPGAAVKPTVGFMFADICDDPANRLPEDQKTIDALIALGLAMSEDSSSEESGIPAAYTYFGQFIDHDITKTVFDGSIQPPDGTDLIEAASFKPLTRADAVSLVSNVRTAPLDLDSVYQGLAKQEATNGDGSMKLGEVSPSGFGPITTADRFHDLPRRPLIVNPTPEQEELDRQALIGDPRNDENLLVAQLHVGILRSHNALMKRGLNAAAAQTAIRRRYQWAVLHDFLGRVCDKSVVDNVLQYGAKIWKVAAAGDLFIPLEFSTAAYRFGHSMIRGEYSHNKTFSPPPEGQVRATFNFFFTFTALSGDLQPGPGPDSQFPSLPDNWIIEWHRFFGSQANPASINPARRIDANLTPELGVLRDFQGIPITNVMGRLASRNLLRGYLLGLPTGQAVAKRLSVPAVAPDVLLAATPSGLSTTIKEAGLLERTPLWFYILAEAGDPAGANGQHLGPVGSRIVAETLWNLAKFATDSVVATPPSKAELDTSEFTLKGLIKIGQDTAMPPITA